MLRHRPARACVAAAIAAAALVITAPAAVAETVVTNFTWDSDTLGAPIPTSFPAVAPQPQTIVYGTGGFPDSLTYTGTVTVGNVGTLNHAAVMRTTQGGTGANYIDTQFLDNHAYNRTSFDLYVETTPATNVPQPAAGAPNGQAFVIQAFDLSATRRAWRFIVAPNASGTGGTFGMRDNLGGDVITFGSYANGSTNNFTIDTDFNLGLVDVYFNNALALSDIPVVNAGAFGLSEFFMFQNGVEGVANVVGIDNFVSVSDDSPVGVPTPAAAPAGALLLSAIATRRRRAN